MPASSPALCVSGPPALAPCTASSAFKLTSCSRPQLRQTLRHASVGGSSQTPIQDDKRDLRNKAQEHSSALVFGGLAAVGATAVWWMMADTSGAPSSRVSRRSSGEHEELTFARSRTDPSKPTLRQTAGDGKPVGTFPPPEKGKL